MSMHNKSAYEHQDWKQVTLKPKASVNKTQNSQDVVKAKEPAKKYNAGKNTQQSSVNGAKIERTFDSEDYEIPHVSHNLKMQIQKARQEKNMTQKQLAFACNFPETVIKNYENGTAVPKSAEINKMSKVLDVKLKN